MKREYRLAKNPLGFNVYKRKDEEEYTSIWFLWQQEKRVLNRNQAKLFYNKEDAFSALVLAKFKWNRKEEDSTSEDQVDLVDKPKRNSWSSLSY